MMDAMSAPNEAAARANWERAQDLLATDMPTVPLVHSAPPAVAQKYVNGFVPSGTVTELLNTVSIGAH
jgi:peptide/nickel transport system substrate-binding protein